MSYKVITSKFNEYEKSKFYNYLTETWYENDKEEFANIAPNLTEKQIKDIILDYAESYLYEVENGIFSVFTKKFLDCEWCELKDTEGNKQIIDLDTFFETLLDGIAYENDN